MKNFAQFAKQAKQLQEKMMQIQEELAEKTVEATAGGGAVTVIANGQGQLFDVKIAPEVVRPDAPDEVDPGDLEMIQDMVLSAANQALELAKELAAAEMGKAAGMPGMKGMGLPGLI